MGSKVIRNITKVFRSASGVLFGRVSASTGRGEELTPSQVRSLLSVYTVTQTDAAISTAVNTLIGGAPGLLDTLDELSAALGDDPNFASTVTNALAGKVDSSSLSESIDDRVSALLNAGTNITLTYNDASNTLTIAGNAGGVSSLGTSGNDLNISGSTLNVPDAGASARGVVSTSAQTFAGKKTLAGGFETYVANIMAGGASTGYTGARDILYFKYGSGSTNYGVVSDQSGAIALGSPAQKTLLNVLYATGEDRVTVGVVGPLSGRASYGMLTVFSPSVAGSSRTFCVANGYNAVTYYVTDGGNQTMSGHLTLGAYTVGTLPSASANAGASARVTDSSVSASGNYGAVVAGGGSGKVKVFSDGTNWIIA